MVDTYFAKVFPFLKAVDLGDGTYALAVSALLYGGLGVDGVYTELSDDETYPLPTGKAGWCAAMLGNDEYFTIFTFTTAGVVTEIISGPTGASIRWTDVDTFFCIYDGGAGPVIKNRTGVAKYLRAFWWCI